MNTFEELERKYQNESSRVNNSNRSMAVDNNRVKTAFSDKEVEKYEHILKMEKPTSYPSNVNFRPSRGVLDYKKRSILINKYK